MALPVTLPPQLFDCVKSPGLGSPIAMLEMVSVSVPVSVIVKFCDAVEPTVVCAKDRLLGFSDGDGGVKTTPTLVRGALWGRPAALSVTLLEADSAAVVLGVKITVNAQLEPAARVAAQVLVCMKSLLFAPVTEIPVIFSVAVPVLTSSMVCGALATPTVAFVNDSPA
jgi:hypothetical protein